MQNIFFKKIIQRNVFYFNKQNLVDTEVSNLGCNNHTTPFSHPQVAHCVVLSSVCGKYCCNYKVFRFSPPLLLHWTPILSVPILLLGAGGGRISSLILLQHQLEVVYFLLTEVKLKADKSLKSCFRLSTRLYAWKELNRYLLLMTTRTDGIHFLG